MCHLRDIINTMFGVSIIFTNIEGIINAIKHCMTFICKITSFFNFYFILCKDTIQGLKMNYANYKTMGNTWHN